MKNPELSFNLVTRRCGVTGLKPDSDLLNSLDSSVMKSFTTW